MDVARASKRIGPRADLTVCLNVITSASTATRNAQWSSVGAVTKPLGFALLVVPALESDEMMQAHSRRARSAKSAATADGLVDRDGSWQKHYRRDELVSVVSQHGLDVKRIGRVFSPWSGEGLDRPPSGNSKGPWDWICLAQRPLRAG